MTARPRLLDLFCGAGGAAVGYWRAGFDVTGVDIKPQPNYPFRFVLGDALEYLETHVDEFDAVHASPPCQAFTLMSARQRGQGGRADSWSDLLTPTLERLRPLEHVAWVVENVVGAGSAMRVGLVLHGGMFGLGVHRPRLFESNVWLGGFKAPACVAPIGVYGDRPDGGRVYLRKDGHGPLRRAASLEQASAAMGVCWMGWRELCESIPPAYTEHIGGFLLTECAARRRVSGLGLEVAG